MKKSTVSAQIAILISATTTAILLGIILDGTAGLIATICALVCSVCALILAIAGLRHGK